MPERTITTPDGVDLHVLDEGQGPAVVLVHGFPELGYSWRHQVPALVAAGYRVLVPDMRGYGRSGRPEAITDYDITHLTGDVVAILDASDVERAVLIGHDWGSMVVWSGTLLHPDRVAGVCGMSVPFIPRGAAPPIATLRALLNGAFFYMVYFQEPGVADAELGADPARTMRRMLAGTKRDPDADATAQAAAMADMAAPDGRGFVDRLREPDTLPDWLSDDELNTYVEAFTRTGFTGGINWYRNLDRNWELTPQLDGATITVPSLFVGGVLDPVLLMSPPAAQDAWLTDHRGTVLIDDAGHWVQQEAPADVNAALVTFLDSVRGDDGTW